MTMNIYVGIRLPRKTEFAAAVMELAMFNWPEMLRHAEDWADGFWAGATSASLMLIAGTAFVLLVRTI
jgi:hypothetical protein